MSERPTHGRAARRTLWAVLGLGVVSVAVFLAAPAGSGWQIAVWFVPPVTVVALLTSVVRSAPAASRPPLWRLWAGSVCYLTAGLGSYLLPVFGVELPFPSPVDALFFVAYGLYACFLLCTLRQQRIDAVARRVAVIDALILTIPASAVLWIGAIRPQLSGAAPLPAVLAAVLYPAFAILLLVLGARVVVSLELGCSVPALLLLVWIGAEVAADIGYGFQSATGIFTHQGPFMVLSMMSGAALATLVAHPAFLRVIRPAPERPAGAGHDLVGAGGMGHPVRLGLLVVTSLLPLVLHVFLHDDAWSLLVASGAALVLIVYRTGLLAGDLGRQRRLAADLDTAVVRLQAQNEDLARFAAIVEATDDAVITLSTAGIVAGWNPAAQRIYGYAPAEIIGRHISTVLSAEDPELLEETLSGLSASGPVAVEVRDRRRDGSVVETWMNVSPVRDAAGAVVAVVAIARDISDRRAREAQLHQESKLESLGRLSAGLAHEINSPIQFVGDNARFLEEAYRELIRVVEVYRGLLDTSSPIGWTERQDRVREVEASIDFEYLQEEIPSAVAQTLEGIERVSTIVRAMKTFSHPGHAEQVDADLNEALSATVTVTRHQVSDVADLELDLGVLPPVRCNIADVNQVFLNLIVNAADAIEETGRRGRIGVATAVDAGDVVVRISDTGGGIPDDVLPKIFDPFFTTKDVGRGSGQGLPLARGVVHEGHGGSLTVESVAGTGSTFTVRLPIGGRQVREPTGAAEGDARLVPAG